MTDPQETDFKVNNLRITILGEPGVGKTSVLRRFLKGTFFDTNSQGILDFGIKLLEDYNGNVGVNYKLYISELSSKSKRTFVMKFIC